jgi:transposase-like protein
VLGIAIGPSEVEPFWTDLPQKLTRRGLRGVKLVISDSHAGIKAAVATPTSSAPCLGYRFAVDQDTICRI